MRLRAVLPVLALAAALSLGACGDDDADTNGGGSAAPPAETQTESTEAPADTNAPAPSGEAVRSAKVEVEDFQFVPPSVTIQEGGKVTWINRDSEEHTATLDDESFDSGPLAEGKLASESFKQTGTYGYYCEIHPEMTGTVEVVAG